MTDELVLYEYPDLENGLCSQIRSRLAVSGYEGLRVSTYLATDPVPAEGQVWLTMNGTVSLDPNTYQDIDFLVRVFAPTIDKVKKLTTRTQAILSSVYALSHSADDGSPFLPIWDSVSGASTGSLQTTELLVDEGQHGYFFTATLTQVSLPTTTNTGE